MSALERVARRIGMTLEHLPGLRTGDTRLVWADKGLLVCEEDELRTYLLTGDRPLRVLADWRDRNIEYVIGTEAGDVLIEAWVVDEGHPDDTFVKETSLGSGRFPTEREAVIALAERIEGEGRE